MRKKFAHQYQETEKTPLISVYVPTYNRADILMQRAVPSVLVQSYKNFELIIIGDCCTDKTEEYVNHIDDPRIRFYNIPQRGYRYPPTAENHWLAGPVVAANTALGVCRGKWIARIDDDDTWTPDHLEKLLKFAQNGNYEFVSSSYIAERRGKRSIVSVKDEIPPIGGTQTWLYRSYLKFFKYNIDCWRKNWNRVNDTDLQDRMYKAKVKMGYIDEVTAYVLPRPGENTIGLDAYLENKKEKENHYKF
ncbi:MAG: glycosyltransferase family 2 protein [Victivallaceae bacterium]|nr:glycosyltransferase family 2 protein [Victivallaceae bacterium]